MSEPTFFRIKNWEKYQHRDHRKSMPWVRLYQDILDDPKMNKLTTYQVGVWCKLLLLSARTSNKMVTDKNYLKTKLNCNRVDLHLFESLGLIEVDRHNTQRADGALNARLEERRGEESALSAQHQRTNLHNTYEPIGSKSEEKKTASPVENLIMIWNETCGSLPKSKGFYFPHRTNLILAALKMNSDLNYWREVFKKASRSHFLTGKGKTSFRAGLDWILKEGNHVKIFEGSYDNQNQETVIVRDESYFRSIGYRADEAAEAVKTIQAFKEFAKLEEKK